MTVSVERPVLLPRRQVCTRLPVVDAVRVLCISWVMWIHIPQSALLQPTTAFAPFRLPTLVILSVFFVFLSQQRHPQRTFLQYAATRLRLLYVPFLGWAAIYYLLHCFQSEFIDHSGWLPVSHGILLHGQTVHLWFVPFIVACNILVQPLALLLGRLDRRAWSIAAGWIVAGLALAALVGPHFTDNFIDYNYRLHIKEFLFRAVTLAPCFPLGIGVYFLFRHLQQRFGRIPPALALIGFPPLLACLAINCAIKANPLLDSVAGLCIVLISFCPTRNRLLLRLGQLGPYAFGMYLSHVLFIDLARMLRENLLHFRAAPWYDILTLLICIPASLLLTVALSRGRRTSWLVGLPHAR